MLRAKPLVLLVLVATGALSLAVMLALSVDTGFLPGMVELSVGLAVAAAMSVVWLTSVRRRAALLKWADQVGWRQAKFGAAGVGILAASASLAALVDGFTWPVGLLAAVLVLFAGANSGAPQASGGPGGRRLPEPPHPVAPRPGPSGLPMLLRRSVTQLHASPPMPAWARCDIGRRPTLRSRRHVQRMRPLRRARNAAGPAVHR